MTEQTQNNQKTVFIALDIAKKTHDAIIALPSGKTIKLRVPNGLDGYQHLLKKASQGDYRIQVAFEPTADHHRNIAYWLHEQGCQCFLVSSLSCARAREMLFNIWDKNDRKDCVSNGMDSTHLIS
jgi:transposase